MDESFKTLQFIDERLCLIDQRHLPITLDYFYCDTSESVAFAIKDMVVRGAPAIGGCAGYGVYLAAKEAGKDKALFARKCQVLASSRPTAVNLVWAIERMKAVAEKTDFDLARLHQEADAIVSEDIAMNKAMSKIGEKVIPMGGTVLTHCNTGALATCGWGSALGVIKMAWYDGRLKRVYADETRPRFQGARLTAWELVEAKIPSTLIPDSAAATLIRDGKIDCVILGADRITANGDMANKLGTFALSVICKQYGVPFYSVAPTSTIDLATATGVQIPIEERSRDEVTHPGGVQVAPDQIDVYNPCFDVTPHGFITGIITERGIIRPPFNENIHRAMQGENV